MNARTPITHRQFLTTVGLAALALAAFRIETLQSTLRAVVVDGPLDAPDGYGRSAYGA